MSNKSPGYGGNPHLPFKNTAYNYTAEQAIELARCMEDPVYFAETYFKIVSVDDGLIPFKLYDFQREAANLYLKSRKMMLATSRQIGKTSIATVIVLHYALFNAHKTIFLLANKADTALEILSRIQLAYEYLPRWLKAGIVEWNKSTVHFDNGTSIAARSSSSDSIRGQSCVTADTRVCVEVENAYYYTEVENVLNKSTFVNIRNNNMENSKVFTVYKTTNLENGKEYIGFHSVPNESFILDEFSINGSLFKDGYLGSGKLIKKAIEKYGPENFTQELLLVTNSKDEAESYEKFLVNESYVGENTNYNLSVGGNICILHGEANGFFGKTHDKHTLDKIQKSRNATYKDKPWSAVKLTNKDNIEFLSFDDVYNFYNLQHLHDKNKRYTLYKMVVDATLKFNSNILQAQAEDIFKSLSYYDESVGKNILADLASKRFKGVPKSKASNEKRGKSISKWIESNPEAHKRRMDKINKNPEKIKKTADKHRGMKRTKKAKSNMSIAQKNKATWYLDTTLNEMVCIKKSEVKANHKKVKRSKYFNKDKNKNKLFAEGYEVIPGGWVKVKK